MLETLLVFRSLFYFFLNNYTDCFHYCVLLYKTLINEVICLYLENKTITLKHDSRITCVGEMVFHLSDTGEEMWIYLLINNFSITGVLVKKKIGENL